MNNSEADRINDYYHKKQSDSSEKSVITKGIKWNLSKNHEEKDICDQYANQDLYGLGPGIYPADKVPDRHTGCKCYLTSVLYEGDELISRIKEKYKTNNRENKSKIYLSESSTRHNNLFKYILYFAFFVTIIIIILIS